MRRAKLIIPLLISLIESTTDPSQMDEMLALNDALTSLLEAVPPTPDSALQDITDDDEKHLRPLLSRHGSGSNSLGLENGHANGLPSLETEVRIELDDELFSPKVDKGKGKAQEQASPVLEKLIMGEPFSITDSDDEDEERRMQAEEELMVLNGEIEEDRPPPVSPTNRSRSWVEEEGEIFRKGQALLSEEEMESEFAGEELRQGVRQPFSLSTIILTMIHQLLVAEVERPPARQLNAQDIFDDNHLIRMEEPEASESAKSPISPIASPPAYLVRQQRSASQDSLR